MSCRLDSNQLVHSDVFRTTSTVDIRANGLTPLRDGEFKLLSLRRGQSSDLVTCDLFIASLDSSVKYEALSYVWGDPDDTKEIKICGEPFYATLNLESALRHLRYRDRERIIWVDAICINQADHSERSHQVLQMDRIYQQAEEVVVWLGLGSTEWSLAIDAIKLLSGDENIHWLPPPYGSVEARDPNRFPAYLIPLQEILCSPWWRRVWILQEAVLARKLTFVCGSGLISGDSLLRIQKIYDRHSQECCNCLPLYKDLHSGMKFVYALRVFRVWRTGVLASLTLFERLQAIMNIRTRFIDLRSLLLEQQSNPMKSDETAKKLLYVEEKIVEGDNAIAKFRQMATSAWNGTYLKNKPAISISQKDINVEELNSLLWQMHFHRYRDCLQDCDRVYAFLGLLSAFSKDIIVPDYHLPPSKVYTNFAFNVIQKSQKLDVFSLILPFPSETECPTWVPDWAHKGFPQMNITLDCRFDLSVSFRASRGLFEEVTMFSDKLCVGGLICDKIVHVASRIDIYGNDWDLRRNWWVMLALNQRHNRLIGDSDWKIAFCHTLLAYIVPTGVNYGWWPKFCLLSELGVFSRRKIRALIRYASNHKVLVLILWKKLLDIASKVEGSILLATHTRRFFISERGSFGLAPMDARPGDQICVLFGGAMPYILRETSEEVSIDYAQHICHSLVGETYVHGLMQGEGIGMIERQEAKAQKFLLR
jgi:hypothetical protein